MAFLGLDAFRDREEREKTVFSVRTSSLIEVVIGFIFSFILLLSLLVCLSVGYWAVHLQMVSFASSHILALLLNQQDSVHCSNVASVMQGNQTRIAPRSCICLFVYFSLAGRCCCLQGTIQREKSSRLSSRVSCISCDAVHQGSRWFISIVPTCVWHLLCWANLDFFFSLSTSLPLHFLYLICGSIVYVWLEISTAL